jgi:hypothetical protein
MTITIRKPGEQTYFDTVPCYQPIKGGMRHLTEHEEKPRNGTVIRFLCEMTYVVGTQRRSPHVYDCSCCREAHLAARGEMTEEHP